MHILIVFAHPLDDSYGAALRDIIVQTLKARGHVVDLCELYKEQFDPVLSAQERRIYKDTSANFKAVSDHVQRLRQAEGVIFVFPKPLLGSIRLFGVVTTTGAPAWFTRFYMGNPSRKVLMRGLARLLAAPRAERFWLALYGMENANIEKRSSFIEQVKSRISRIRV
jgi:putative NADPH-quinone reductase